MLVRQIKEFLNDLDDDESIDFAVIHRADKKYLVRSIQNNVAVMLERPVVILKALCTGRGGQINEKETPTIYLAGTL